MKRIGFYLVNGFAMMSTAAAMEPLRAANLFADRQIYDIVALSHDGTPASSSLAASFPTQAISDQLPPFDLVFVVAGGNPVALRDQKLFAWLKRQDRQGVALGGISGGSAILARAGLLENRRFTVHWHHIDDLRQQSDSYLIERRLFIIDRNRYTCAGGTAPLDMMHAIIAAEHGTPFARRIADWFIQTEIRPSGAPQQTSTDARFGPLPNPVSEAIALMESHLGDPLDVAQLASLVDLSPRQLQRLFQTSLKQSVAQFYRKLRLDLARHLLEHTRLPLTEISQMAGFTAQSSFSVAFATQIGCSPSRFRKQTMTSAQST